VSHYKVVANIRTDPPGKPFDRQSAFCCGTFASLNGRNQDFGICEATDADGDVWWLEYHGNPDGAGGTYTSPYGTGKYEGMTVKAHTWPILGPAPPARSSSKAASTTRGLIS
jgi:hypothetical protein